MELIREAVTNIAAAQGRPGHARGDREVLEAISQEKVKLLLLLPADQAKTLLVDSDR
jgi:hypothetical protein